jgi:hypothetical protein
LHRPGLVKRTLRFSTTVKTEAADVPTTGFVYDTVPVKLPPPHQSLCCSLNISYPSRSHTVPNKSKWYYWFASQAHKDLFKSDPLKYAPLYGAFCGYAVSLGKLRPVDPTIYQIENGWLILQHTREAYQLFNKDLKNNLAKADGNWPRLVASHVGKPVQYHKQAPRSVAAKSFSGHNWFYLVKSFPSFKEERTAWPPENTAISLHWHLPK